MEFVTSGAAALALMAQKPVDVVVSDMKMPQMDGAQLLAEIRTRHPSTVRIILSGFAERESILRTIGPSHRYLAKPCSHDVLVSAIQQAMALHNYIGGESVKATVATLTHLPTLPATYSAILRELESEYASADTLADKVVEDVAISAQLMKLTNSAYFSLPVKATTVKQAVQALGFENVRAVVLLAGVFDQFRNLSPSLALAVEDLTRHSLELGVLAQALAKKEKLPDAVTDHAFCAGLLAHVGTLLLIANYATDLQTAMSDVEQKHLAVCAAEQAKFGASHAQLGAYLLGLWGFNDNIVEAVAYHHRPSDAGPAASRVLTMVHAAQYLMRASSTVKVRREAFSPIDTDHLEAVGLASHVPAWRDACDELVKEWSNG